MNNFDIATDITNRLLNRDIIKTENWSETVSIIEECLDELEDMDYYVAQ